MVLWPSLLVEGALILLVNPSALGGERLGVLDQALGPSRRDEVHEVRAPHLEHVIDERLELGSVTEGQLALEDHPVKARKTPGDQAGKLRDERAYCLHGIRFLNDCW